MNAHLRNKDVDLVNVKGGIKLSQFHTSRRIGGCGVSIGDDSFGLSVSSNLMSMG